MKKAALLFLWIVVSMSLFAQGEGEMTVSNFTHCHSPNYCANIQSLTAKWFLSNSMNEPYIRISFKWTAGANTPANFFDSRDFIVLRCVASVSSQTVGYIRSGGDSPVSGRGYGANTGSSPSWTNVFCDAQGQSLELTAQQAKEIWKKGFSVTGVSLVRSGGLDADKPRTAPSGNSNNNSTSNTTTITGSPQLQRLAELQAKQKQLEAESRQRQQQYQQQEAQERNRQQQQQAENNRQQQAQQQEEYNSQQKAKAIEQYNNFQRSSNEANRKLNEGVQQLKDMVAAGFERDRQKAERKEALRKAELREEMEEKARREAEEKAKEEREQEEWRLRVEQENREKEAKEAQSASLAQYRQEIINEFKPSGIPLSFASVQANKLYYFGFSCSPASLKNGNATFYITQTFEVDRRADGTWPYKVTVMSELKKLLPNPRVLHGHYFSYEEAEQNRQALIGMLTKSGMKCKERVYGGKIATVPLRPLPGVLPAVKKCYEEAENHFNESESGAALSKLSEAVKQGGGNAERVAYLRVLAYDQKVNFENLDSLELLLSVHKTINTYLSTFASYPLKEKYEEVKAIQKKYEGTGFAYQRIASVAAGDAEAQYQLGLHYYKSNQVRGAFRYLTLSAEQKHPKACGKAGLLYYTGLGDRKPDLNKSAKYLRWAVEANDWEGTTLIGFLYRDGVAPFPKDRSKANEYFRKAYEMSQTQENNYDADGAMFLTGHFYRYGYYGEPDYPKALFWYQKAVDAENSVYHSVASTNVDEVSRFITQKRAGDECFDKKDYARAIGYYECGYKIIEDAKLRDRMFETYINLAEQQFNEKRIYQSIRNFDSAGELVKDDQKKLKILLSKREFVDLAEINRQLDYISSMDRLNLDKFLAGYPNGIYRAKIQQRKIDFVYPNQADYCYDRNLYNDAKRLYIKAMYTCSDSSKIPQFQKKLEKCMKRMPTTGAKQNGFAYEQSFKDDWTSRKLVVTKVFQGSAAEKEGLKINDVITHIDGIPAEKLELWQVNDLMQDYPGDEYAGRWITVIRPGEVLRKVIRIYGK